MERTIYECDTCGRYDVKPLAPNHFHPDVAKGVCGAPTVGRTYRRVETIDTLRETLEERVRRAA